MICYAVFIFLTNFSASRQEILMLFQSLIEKASLNRWCEFRIIYKSGSVVFGLQKFPKLMKFRSYYIVLVYGSIMRIQAGYRDISITNE